MKNLVLIDREKFVEYLNVESKIISSKMLALACLDQATVEEPKKYCSGDHCGQMWNLPCDDEKHNRSVINPPTRPEPTKSLEVPEKLVLISSTYTDLKNTVHKVNEIIETLEEVVKELKQRGGE